MPETGSTRHLEQLLGETAWVRSLAARLTGSRQDADDLAQDVWVAALERPPRSPGPGLRGWARAVLHKLAARQRRRELRRSQREQVAAGRRTADESGDPMAEELERVRLHRALTDAVLSLEEPYRSAVVLRHFEGKSYAELARRQGVSADAARQRVSRAYAMLRGQLQRRGVDRGRLMALVAAFESPWPVGAALLGGVVMKAVALAAAGVVGVTALVWCVFPPPPPALPVGAGRASAPPPAAAAPLDTEGTGSAERAGLPRRRVMAAHSPDLVPAPPPPVVTGIVLDAQHLTVAPPGTVWLAVVAADGERHEVRGDIDASGRFRTEVPPGRLAQVRARAKGYRPLELELDRRLEPASTEQLELVLPGGAVVEGIVLDATTRAPLPGAEVWCEGTDYEPDSVEPTAVADAMGRFRLEGVDPDRYHTEDGQVLALVRLRARTERHAPAPLRAYAAPWSDEEHYEFEVLLDRAPCSLIGRVLEPGGREVASGRLIHLVDALGNCVVESTNRRGEFELERVATGPLHLFVRPWDFGGSPAAPTGCGSLELMPGANRVEVTLCEPTAVLSGRLVSPAGEAVPDTDVEIQLCFATPSLRVGIESFRTVTGPDGRFRFEHLPAATYELAPCGEGVGRPARLLQALAAGQVVDDLELVYGPKMRVAGTVHGGALPADQLELQLREPGREESLEAVTPGADGAFVFEAVLRAAYDLVAVHDGRVVARQFVSPGSARGLELRVR